MIPASNKPDLRRIGESAFTEVLSKLLSLSATPGTRSHQSLCSNASDQIAGTVQLAGPRLSGIVRIQLPLEFVAHGVRVLTGLDGTEGDISSVQDDAAGEIANMVAGRVGAQLAVDGYPCTLSTPSVSRCAHSPIELEPGTDHERTELFCDGHWLILELKCRYTVP